MKKLVVVVCLSIIFFINGCGIVKQGDEKPIYFSQSENINQTKADEAKQIVLSMNEVIAVRGASFEDDIFIAIKVNQFDRLFLDRIRKEASDKIKKRYPEITAHVSTDKKVFLELEKLEKQIQENKVKTSEIKKQWIRIEKFMKG